MERLRGEEIASRGQRQTAGANGEACLTIHMGNHKIDLSARHVPQNERRAFIVFSPHFRFRDQNAGAERHNDCAVHPLCFYLAGLCAADGHGMGIDADDRAAHDASAAEGGVDRVPLLPLFRRKILIERTEVQIVEGFLLWFAWFWQFFRCARFFFAVWLHGFLDLRRQSGLFCGGEFFNVGDFRLHSFFLQHFGFGFFSGHM